MYKNQLQELAQRSCFNLPSYACIREGPDHAPRFKATVNFNGEIFESPTFCTTLRQAEHAAAELALKTLSMRGPSRSLAAKVLDETGVYKNLLQETAHRAGLNLPVYTTVRSGPGHMPVFTCTVELGGMSFKGEQAKTKKQAQKNAAIAAWSALKQFPRLGSSSSSSSSSPSLGAESSEEQEQVTVARALATLNAADGNKRSAQNDRQRGMRKPGFVHRDMNPASGMSFYPSPYQSWTYSHLPTEFATYQMWQQEQASHQQSHLLTLPAPPPPSDPRVFPFTSSIFSPTHYQYFPVLEQESISGVPGFTVPDPGSSLYFSDQSVSVPVRSRSRVTIQEIHEEKTHREEKEWLCNGTSDAGRDTGSQHSNLQPKSSGFPPFKVQNPPIPTDSHAEPQIQGSEEDKTKNGGSGFTNTSTNRESSIGGNSGLKPVVSGSCLSMVHNSIDDKRIQEIQQEELQREQHGWLYQGPVHVNREAIFRSRASNASQSYSQFQSHDPSLLYSSRVNPIHHPPTMSSFRPPSLAAPVTIRTAVTASSANRRADALNTGVPLANFMAPAVQVRPVIPVSSAAPEGKSPELRQGKLLSGHKAGTQEPEDVSAANSELGKLRI
ncbi:double-stranded RNA-binding protein 2-like [Tasmannia lanceolata]|uniref:double-stranded RNA-binding protein 2-like n=1 Tax=Tasmannia lanceolata TaxID=3420 RepID=UPI00406321D5